tara:strand:+ start:5205 stop:5918 length:714 start_codon:yes stop_codon:yes gene_type:complete
VNKENTLVISPTYNESGNIAKFIDQVISTGCDLLIIDDKSPDKTAEKIKASKYFGKKLYLIERKGKLGYGTACIDGFNWGIKKEYAYIIQMDADFSHRIEDLKNIRSEFTNYRNEIDVCIGSRYVKGGGSSGWGLHRKILSKYANKFAKFVTKSNINDMTTGFRLYTRESLKKIPFEESKYNGYSFLVDLLHKCVKADLRIKEIPILFVEREVGKSKMNLKIILEGVKTLFKLYFYK